MQDKQGFTSDNNNGDHNTHDLSSQNVPVVLALPALNNPAEGPRARPPIHQNRATDENPSENSEEEIWDEDHLLPLANVISTMRRVLPADAGVPSEVAQMIQRGTSDFILLVTCQAKERCRLEGREKIKGEDMIWALKKLGFTDYVALLELFLSRLQGTCTGDNIASSSMTPQSKSSKKQKE